MVTEQDLKKHFRTLGSIKTPRPVVIVGWVLGIGSILSILFLIFVPWVQTTAGIGIVTSLHPEERLQEINAFVSGRIKNCR